MTKKYNLEKNPIKSCTEELKQEITAISHKIQQYTARCETYCQNKMFDENQRRFYEDLFDKNCQQSNEMPDKKETTAFLSNVWGKTNQHNENAEWMPGVEAKLQDIPQQDNLDIPTALVKKVAKSIVSWKSPGYCIKNLSSLHERLAWQLQSVVEGNIPEWISKAQTSLIMKNKDIGPKVVTNYRPITCLSTTWKLLTSIISNTIYDHLSDKGLIPWEQKVCKRKSRGMKDQLLIDKMIMKHAKGKQRNLRMTWMDYKKAYDSVPYFWIVRCMGLVGVAINITSFMEKAVKMWNTTLTINGETIGEVKIKSGIFQGDSLSPLLFIISLIPLTTTLRAMNKSYKLDDIKVNHLLYMDDLKIYGCSEKEMESLVNTIRIFSDDISMEFGFEICAKVSINKGKLVPTENLKLPSGKEI